MNTIYVSKDGNDQKGDGSIQKPFATLEKARDLARQLSGAATVYLREGTWFLQEPITFCEWDKDLTITACPGEQVVFCGAKCFENLEWKKDPVNTQIWNARISCGLHPDRLFADGIPYHMARFPDYQENTVPLGGVVTEEQIRERSKNWAHPETGYIRALHSAGWGGNDYYILGKDSREPLGLALEWVGDNNRGHLYKKDALVAENIKEELDCPGEWFYDAQTGILSVIPYDGYTWTGQEKIELVLNTELLRFVGSTNKDCIRNIRIVGIGFENTARTMFTTRQPGKEYFPLLRGDWAVVRSGSIYLENAENITIENCSFRHIGGNGVFAWGYHAGHVIRNNEWKHIGSTAISLVGSPKAVSDPSFWEHQHYPKHPVHADRVMHPAHVGPVSEDYPRDIEISQNHIFDIGIFEKQSTGINLSVTSRIRVLHNTIHKSARSNININDGTFGGHEIAYNDVFDSQTETSDHGPFNSWGRDRFWSVPGYDCMGNHGKTVRHYCRDGKEYDIALLDAYQTTRIHHNRFQHDNIQIPSWGIDLDDGSSNYEIFGNLCLGIGIKLREGFERRVHHNIIVDGQIQLHCTYYEAKDQIYRNLFVHSSPWGFAGLGENPVRRLLEGKLLIDGNAYWGQGAFPELPEFWEELGFDKNICLGEDPFFKDPSKGNFVITNEKLLHFLQLPEEQFWAFGKKGCPFCAPVYKMQQTAAKTDLCETLWKGAVISNIDQGIMSATATAGTNGVYFKYVPKESQAYTLGYRTGQIIKTVNGKTIENVDDFLHEI